MSFIQLLLVGLGGFFGAICRLLINQITKQYIRSVFPIATLIVNLTGSFMLGAIIGIGYYSTFTLFLSVGFMGAFTTFSTFKLESMELYLQKRKWEFWISNILCYGGSILFVFVGLKLGKILF